MKNNQAFKKNTKAQDNLKSRENNSNMKYLNQYIRFYIQ